MSVASDLAGAIVTAITSLSLTYGSTSFTVVRRKVPSLPQGKDPPQVVVTIGEEPDTEYLTGRRNLNKYPVAVTLVTARGAPQADDDAIRAIHQQIRQLLDDKERATFAAVTGFNRMTTGGRMPFNPAALGRDLNYSPKVFTAEVLETRAT